MDGTSFHRDISCRFDRMTPVEQAGLMTYRFPNLDGIPGLRHEIFTRIGGNSSPPYQSLNLAKSVGDRPADVAENRGRVLSAMGRGRLVFLRQVHGTTVVVAADDSGKRADQTDTERFAGEGDALITDRPELWLTILVADCQAVLLFDPGRRVVANIHSGWRGSVGNIVGVAVSKMVQHFGTNPQNLIAGIGPSLGPCCAEFVHYQKEIPRNLWRYMGPGYRFDFWEMTRQQLVRAGVRLENICNSGICTRCSTDFFFSYRGEKKTGRFAAVIGIDASVKTCDRPTGRP